MLYVIKNFNISLLKHFISLTYWRFVRRKVYRFFNLNLFCHIFIKDPLKIHFVYMGCTPMYLMYVVEWTCNHLLQRSLNTNHSFPLCKPAFSSPVAHPINFPRTRSRCRYGVVWGNSFVSAHSRPVQSRLLNRSALAYPLTVA